MFPAFKTDAEYFFTAAFNAQFTLPFFLERCHGLLFCFTAEWTGYDGDISFFDQNFFRFH
jgi:hypothetical protein